MNDCAIVILGATGDLTKRKLIPALYGMVRAGKLKKFTLIGVAFENVTIDHILAQSAPYIEGGIDEAVWAQLHKNSYYQQLNFNNESDYKKLSTVLDDIEKKHAFAGNRLFYLAAASTFYCAITHNLVASGCAQKIAIGQPKWHRLVYEKPFGHDLKSAHAINECIAAVLYEDQAFRVDHYLTKEMVNNIALLRFTNCVLEPLWNNRFIDNVQIILTESGGVEERGGYYDQYGALRDVVQNHMLELLALIAMETPVKLTGDFIRQERANVLQKVRFVDAVLGQYEGYVKEKFVQPDSKTETFAALFLMIDNPRWAGVPFYLKTGKALDKKETVIHIKFKQVDCLLTKHCPSESNYLTIRLIPDESFTLSLNAKKPGSPEIVPIAMQYCHSCIVGVTVPTAHEALFEEVMRGEQSVSVRFDEIEYSWKLIDAISSRTWPIDTYKVGSTGPAAAEQFAKKHGMRWRS